MSMTTAEVLRQARALIEDEANWAQGWFNVMGGRCSSGALQEAMGMDECGAVADTPPYEALRRAMGCREYGVCAWNDHHSHAEVLAAFDKAIAAEEAKA